MGEVQRRVGVAPEHGGGRHELELKLSSLGNFSKMIV